MLSKNFPERKRKRQIKALDNLIHHHEYKILTNKQMEEIATLTEVTQGNRRGVRTKKNRVKTTLNERRKS
jgi:NADH:ubiquinone oxidoreductase subunit E